MGSHILDVARFMFWRVRAAFVCQTLKVNQTMRGRGCGIGHDADGKSHACFADLSYSSVPEQDAFTTVFILAEGDKGTLYLGPGFEIRTTTRQGTTSEIVKFPAYPWASPDYIVNHESGQSSSMKISSMICLVKGSAGNDRER
ncbi:MAG: hypothetical protein U5K79_24115 [Cyclobacteriaceae bacterium]|nr:hypothetical protein [Cyclobacteriaceae bacterium]